MLVDRKMILYLLVVDEKEYGLFFTKDRGLTVNKKVYALQNDMEITARRRS
jgi:hypothetical protein